MRHVSKKQTVPAAAVEAVVVVVVMACRPGILHAYLDTASGCNHSVFRDSQQTGY
jgi:hypothetical protein